MGLLSTVRRRLVASMSSSGADLVIEMQGITKMYGQEPSGVLAVDNVDLAVPRGEFLAIMGPSGSGKSTLMNIIGCLDHATEGSYRLDGTDVADLKSDELAQVRRLSIGFVFQTFNLLPRLSALRNVELPMVYAGMPGRMRRERSQRLLETVGLGHRLNHRPNELSGGERQRVAIARSLANEPAVLLADEPTGNLDSRSGADIVTLLSDLNAQGRTVVLITHAADVACHAQRVVHLLDGRIVGEGSPGPPPQA